MKIYKTSVGFVELSPLISLNVYAIGCKKRCPGCCNAKLQDFDYEPHGILTNAALHDAIYDSDRLIRAVCWLGGDAVYQPERYLELSTLAAKCGMLNCLFTGLEMEEIDPSILVRTNYVVAGEWRGRTIDDPQTNQKIYASVIIPTSEEPEFFGWRNIPYPFFKQLLKESL